MSTVQYAVDSLTPHRSRSLKMFVKSRSPKGSLELDLFASLRAVVRPKRCDYELVSHVWKTWRENTVSFFSQFA